MKTRQESTLKPLTLRVENLENRELLSAAPWSATVDSTDAQIVETASAQLEQDAVIDLSNAQLEDSVSFANTGVTNSQFALSWDAIDGAATYSVKINRDGAWIQYNKGLTDTSCVMNGLYSGKTYEIRVCAVNENGKLTGDYLQTSFAPVRGVGSVNKFVAGDELGVTVLGSEDASYDIAWYYATPDGDVEITEARGLLTYAPENPQHDVKVVVTGTGLSAGSGSETLFVYSGDQTVETSYDPESKTLQVVAPEVDGAVKYYIWKPAPSGNMAIYQRTTEPVFTVTKLAPGQTTNFRVSAYDAKGKVLDSKDFKFASVSLDAPELYEVGSSIDVTVGADASLNYDLLWYYVTESGDVEITEAKGQTSFTPDAATYPIKIVATPIADAVGLCVSAPVEAIVDPDVSLKSGVNDPYVTTKQSFNTTWNVVPGATRYAVQKLSASGAWAKMTAFNFVDGQIVGDTRATLSEDGTQFSYSVNMVKIGVEETYRVLAIDAKGAVIQSGEFAYNPVGLTVENDAYDLGNGSQTLRAVTVQGIDDSLQYQWYYSTNDDPTNWQLVDGATSAELVLSASDAAQNYNYKVIATDPNEDRQSVAFARAETLDAPTNLTRSVNVVTGDLVLTWNADANLSADNFIAQYYRTDGEYSAWVDLPQGTIVANGDGTFSLTHVNGEKYQYVRVRANDATGWSEWNLANSVVVNDPYVTTKRSFVTTWNAVPGATRYAVQKLNASGAWVKMTAFDVVDGEIVGDTRATLSEDGTQFSYSVNMVKIGVEETYRVLAIDAKGSMIETIEFAYNPVGLTVENDAYDLNNGSQTLRAVTVQGIDDSLQYQWYYSTNDDPTNWVVVDGATSAELVLSADAAAQNYNYKVLATDPNEERQSVSYARADTLDAPTNLTRTVDADTGDLLLTWKADANLSADNFIVQYYRTDGEYSAWSDLPQGTIVANGDGTFSLAHVNGENYKYLRVRAVDETGWSEWNMTVPGGLVVDTKKDIINPNDGQTSWREAVETFQALAAEGAIPPGIAVTFDPNVFKNSSSKISLKVNQPIVVITENVRIDASNLGYRLQMQAPNSKRNVFQVVGENASLELVSLNLFGANHAIDGAIIHAEDGATVKVVDCAFASNRTSQHGGAIALFGGSKLIVENSLFQNNSAQLGGGAIYAVDGSSVVVKDSTFTNNSAGGDGNGGAIWLDASSTLEVENSTFTPEGSSSLSGKVTSSQGSAIWIDDSVVSDALLDEVFVTLDEEIELFF